jgi:hypothetical protein
MWLVVAATDAGAESCSAQNAALAAYLLLHPLALVGFLFGALALMRDPRFRRAAILATSAALASPAIVYVPLAFGVAYECRGNLLF